MPGKQSGLSIYRWQVTRSDAFAAGLFEVRSRIEQEGQDVEKKLFDKNSATLVDDDLIRRYLLHKRNWRLFEHARKEFEDSGSDPRTVLPSVVEGGEIIENAHYLRVADFYAIYRRYPIHKLGEGVVVYEKRSGKPWLRELINRFRS